MKRFARGGVDAALYQSKGVHIYILHPAVGLLHLVVDSTKH